MIQREDTVKFTCFDNLGQTNQVFFFTLRQTNCEYVVAFLGFKT